MSGCCNMFYYSSLLIQNGNYAFIFISANVDILPSWTYRTTIQSVTRHVSANYRSANFSYHLSCVLVYFDIDCVHCLARHILLIFAVIWSCCDAAFKFCSTQVVLLALELCITYHQYGSFSYILIRPYFLFSVGFKFSRNNPVTGYYFILRGNAGLKANTKKW